MLDVHLQVRATGNPREIMFGLRIDLIRNIANIAKRCVVTYGLCLEAGALCDGCPAAGYGGRIQAL